MPIEVNAGNVICGRCGMAYKKRKGFFNVSYAPLFKGTGHIPICKTCVEALYNEYLSQCQNSKDAIRQVCRKLDLYWNEAAFDMVYRKGSPRSIMTQYIIKINTNAYAGKCYDDTLSDEGTLWSFKTGISSRLFSDTGADTMDDMSIPADVISFWGSGYTPSMYLELEQRRQYYMTKLQNSADLDIGSEILIRQICNLEVTIAKDSAAGKSIDKSINSLNTLLGSLNIKPKQRSAGEDESINNTPLGVWLQRYEFERPLPETDKSLQDVNHFKEYIFTWMGHLCKMLGIKNGYTQMYEKEIARLRVEKPEYDDEDDETVIINSYSNSGDKE